MRNLTVLVGCLLLLMVGSSVPQEDHPMDHCGSCHGSCAAVDSGKTCQCDSDCGLYGDCCPDDPCSSPGAAAVPTEFQCHSVFAEGSYPAGPKTKTIGVQEGYWMVSGCREGWPDQGTEQQCRGGGNALSPVTDRATGVVYRNEYCAICNGPASGVTTIVPWRYQISCSEELQALASTPGYTLTREDIEEFCQPCSYIQPEPFSLTSGLAAPDPRPCYPHVSTCLPMEELELSPEEYSDTAMKCSTRPYSLLVDYQGVMYRNRYCALCNGIRIEDRFINCADPRDLERVSSCTNEPPTTQPTTEPPTENCTGLDCGGTDTTPTVTTPQEPFSLTLDIFGDGQIKVEGTITQTVVVNCAEGEVFDPVHSDCRQTVCPEGFALQGGDCHFSLDDSGEDIYCPEGSLLTLNSTEFENGTTPQTVLYNGTEYYIVSRDTSGRPTICLSIATCPDGYTLYLTNESLVEYVNNATIRFDQQDYEVLLRTADGEVLFCLSTPPCPEGYNIHTEISNLTVFVDNDTILYGQDEYEIVWRTPIGEIVICLPQSGTKEVNVTVVYYDYPDGFSELTYIGCSLSIIGCILILLTYGLFTDLRQSIPSKILMNLAVTILVSNVLIMVAGYGRENQDVCTAMAIALHLFFLVQFSWMSVMMFELGRTFRGAQKLAPNLSARSKVKLFIVYFLLGWGVPLIIVAVTVAVNFTMDDLVLYGEEEDGTQGSCWINHEESAIIAFLVPVAVSIIFNVVAFTFLAVWICKAWKIQSELKKTQNVPYLRIYLAVASTTGITWLFGFAAILIGESWAWYPFIIFNSAQGFFIFMAFLFTKKVWNHYRMLLTGQKEKETTSLPSSKQTSLPIRNSVRKDARNIVATKSDLNSAVTCTSPPNGVKSEPCSAA